MKSIAGFVLISTGCCGAALAQSSVTLYGSMDAGIGYNNNVGGHSQVEETSGNSQPDIWGMRGVEDLGGGMSVGFNLQSGFLTQNGASTRSGYIFNRDSTISLGSVHYGSLTMGHTLTFSSAWVNSLDASVLGYIYQDYHPGNIDELTASTNAMSDNVVRYVTPVFYGFQAGVQMGLGNTTNFATGRSTGYALRYNSGPLHAALAYAIEADRPTAIGSAIGISSFQGVSGSQQYIADRLADLDGSVSYDIGPFTLHGLYSNVVLKHAGYSNTFSTIEAGTNYHYNPFNLIDVSAFTSTLMDHRWTQFSVTEMYFLSKSTNVYAEAIYQHATGGPAVIYSNSPSSTGTQVAFRTGVHHSF